MPTDTSATQPSSGMKGQGSAFGIQWTPVYWSRWDELVLAKAVDFGFQIIGTPGTEGRC